MPARIDIPPGSVFGRWTVIEEAPVNGKRGMRSQCECGTIAVVAVGHLRSGRSTSCGCASRVDVPPGTAFGHLTTITETRVNGRRAMLCQCDCGEQRTAALGELRSGGIRVCGPMHGVVADAAKLNPGEVPLYGKLARGRIALVDPEDMPLVMQYRWNVWEYRLKHQGNQLAGPYAIASLPRNGGPKRQIRMHNLIMGAIGVDHRDGHGLNNSRSNLRLADQARNSQNRRPNPPGASAFKGVRWDKRRMCWTAMISDRGLGQSRHLGSFANELEAAYAYDAAARSAFGEFGARTLRRLPRRPCLSSGTPSVRPDAPWRHRPNSAPRLSGGHSASLRRASAQYAAKNFCPKKSRERSTADVECKRQAALQREYERQQEGRLF